jgi:hypothetical protein
MQAQPIPSNLASRPIAIDCRIGESPHGISNICPFCLRGGMHRAHRESYLDFLLSMVGIHPTTCCYCKTQSRKLYLHRLAVRLLVASIAAGFLAFCVMRLYSYRIADDREQTSSAVSATSQANSKSAPLPADSTYGSPKAPVSDVSLNPQAPPVTK